MRTLFIKTVPYAYFGVDGGIGPSGILRYFSGGKKKATHQEGRFLHDMKKGADEGMKSCRAAFVFSPF